MQVSPMGFVIHEVWRQKIHHDNTVGESVIDNSWWSSFVNDSLSNDFNSDDVSELYGQASFDIRSICPKCACTCIGESCFCCQENAEYDVSLGNDASKTGECCYTNLLRFVRDSLLGSAAPAVNSSQKCNKNSDVRSLRNQKVS